MSKWKCGICGSEFENYHAQGFDDTIYCPLCYFKEIYKREQKKTKLLQNQLQQKENIIKEIEKYIDSINDLGSDFVSSFVRGFKYKLNEIKEVNK